MAADNASSSKTLPVSIVNYSGGEYSSQYPVGNVLKAGGKAWSTKNGEKKNAALILKLGDEGLHQLTKLEYKGPGSGYTAAAGDTLVLVSRVKPTIDDVKAFSDTSSLDDAHVLKQAAQSPLTPVLFFQAKRSTSVQSHLVQACPPARFMSLLFIKSIPTSTGTNIDVGSFQIFGQPAAVVTAPLPMLGAAEALRYLDAGSRPAQATAEDAERAKFLASRMWAAPQ